MSYLLRRALYALPILLGVALLCFSLVHIAPGDPLVSILLGVASMTVELLGYLALCSWMQQFSPVAARIMLVCTVVFMPIILAYTSWVYSVLWGKVDEKQIRDGSGHAY